MGRPGTRSTASFRSSLAFSAIWAPRPHHTGYDRARALSEWYIAKSLEVDTFSTGDGADAIIPGSLSIRETERVMKRLFLLLCAVVLCSAGCSKPTEPTGPTEPANVLMELKTGNRWAGRTSSRISLRYDTLWAIGDTMIGSERWHNVTPFSEGAMVADVRPDWVGGPQLINRVDGLYTTVWNPPTGHTIERRVKYPVAIGDTAIDFGWFQLTDPDGTTHGPRTRSFGVVTALRERITVPAGSFDAFKVEFRDMGDPPDPSFDRSYDVAWFAPRAGLVRADEYDRTGAVVTTWELTGLTLN